MNSKQWIGNAASIAAVALLAGCATNNMDRADKGTAVGGATGAVVGAVAGGPVGAVVGAGVGAYAGNVAAGGSTDPSVTTNASHSTQPYDSTLVRSVQRSLNEKGFDAGPVDGAWGARTQNALRDFQQAKGLPVTGTLDRDTRAMLGVERIG